MDSGSHFAFDLPPQLPAVPAAFWERSNRPETGCASETSGPLVIECLLQFAY